MSDINGASTEGMPQLNVLAQYTKDLSFENPNAPRSLGPQESGPNITIQVNVNLRQLAETDFEVELLLEGSAVDESSTLFKFDLTYAGVFRLQNIPHKHECRRTCFRSSHCMPYMWYLQFLFREFLHMRLQDFLHCNHHQHDS